MNRFLYFFFSLAVSLFLTSCTRVPNEQDLIKTSIGKARIRSESGGPTLECKELSIKEVSAKFDMTEEKAQKLKSSCQAIYEMKASGFCPGDRYTLYLVNMLYNKSLIGKM
jgi:hypothetical protein